MDDNKILKLMYDLIQFVWDNLEKLHLIVTITMAYKVSKNKKKKKYKKKKKSPNRRKRK